MMMLPHADTFSEEMRKLDVRKTDRIVCYDQSGMVSAPRAYWMLKVFGADNV
jgi:thiosulfate/3-mercaptopyruvate sulfurtransferase